MKKISQNYALTLINQILMTAIPLILMPFLARTITETGMGEYAFNKNILMYFSLFAMLGINIYGTRTIAAADDADKKRIFFEIFILKLFSSSIIIAIYLLFTFFVFQNTLLLLVIGLTLIANLIDINWFFQGIEEFKIITLLNTVARLIGVILIFTLVRSPEDVLIYALIMAGTEILGQVLLWLILLKKFKQTPRLVDKLNPIGHLKKCLLVFSPLIIIQIYTIMNITLLGLFGIDNGNIGFYDMVIRLNNIFLIIITSFGVVIIPRISQLHANNNHTEVRKILNHSYKILTYISIPMALGLFAIAPMFVTWYFGESFAPMIILLRVSAVKIILITISNIIGVQYLIPTGKTRQFTTSVAIGALVNLVFSLALIHNFGVMGVMIAAVVAELTVTCTQILMTHKDLHFIKHIKETIKVLIASLVMVTLVIGFEKILYPIVFSEINIVFGYFMTGLLVNGIVIILAGFVYLAINAILKVKIQTQLIEKVLR